MKIAKIPDYILDDLTERGLSAKNINESTPEQLFCEYCDWHGLVDWGEALITVLEDLRNAN